MVLDFFGGKKKIHSRIDYLHSSLTDSFERIKVDIKKVSGWISHFDSKTKDHEKKLSFVLKKLEVIEHLLIENENIKEKSLEDDQTIERIQSFNRSNQSFMNVQSLKNLTPAQKQILVLLSFAGGPLGYDDMSKKLGLSIITVRRHLNDIKRAGISMEEKVSARGRKKVFLIDKKTKSMLLKQKVRVKDE